MVIFFQMELAILITKKWHILSWFSTHKIHEVKGENSHYPKFQWTGTCIFYSPVVVQYPAKLLQPRYNVSNVSLLSRHLTTIRPEYPWLVTDGACREHRWAWRKTCGCTTHSTPSDCSASIEPNIPGKKIKDWLN